MMFLAYRKRKLGKNELPGEVYECFKTPYSFLLDSGGSSENWSFIGYNPQYVIEKSDKRILKKSFSYVQGAASFKSEQLKGDVFSHIENLNQEYRLPDSKNMKNSPPFVGGACGFFSYDFGLQMLKIKDLCKSVVECPDVCMAWYNKILAFDKAKNELWFMALAQDQQSAEGLLAQIESDSLKKSEKELKVDKKLKNPSKIIANLSFKQYENALKKIKKHLLEGETYQVNFAQQFQLKSEFDPWQVYKKLFSINPSAQASFFHHPDFAVVSASPERLVSVRNGIVQTCPIKGTLKRGKNLQEDKRQIGTLLASAKNEAELAMIVDLARNDLGRVCEPASVKVTNHRAIIKLSHVIHTYSIVEGRIAKNISLADVFKALFPGGSITGCPKKRTMEIIAALEGVKRGVYCGSAGYFSANGNMDFNIMIRTLFYRNGSFYFGAGGGIVIDSDAVDEYGESFNKAEALMQSLA